MGDGRPGKRSWLSILPGLVKQKSRSVKVKVAQSCPTLCDPMDCTLPGSSIHGIFQSRILEWVAISFSRGSSRPRDWTLVSCIVGRRFTIWATRKVLVLEARSKKSRFQQGHASSESSRNGPAPGISPQFWKPQAFLTHRCLSSWISSY